MDFAFEAEIIALRRGRDEVRGGGEASAEQAAQSKQDKQGRPGRADVPRRRTGGLYDITSSRRDPVADLDVCHLEADCGGPEQPGF